MSCYLIQPPPRTEPLGILLAQGRSAVYIQRSIQICFKGPMSDHQQDMLQEFHAFRNACAEARLVPDRKLAAQQTMRARARQVQCKHECGVHKRSQAQVSFTRPMPCLYAYTESFSSDQCCLFVYCCLLQVTSLLFTNCCSYFDLDRFRCLLAFLDCLPRLEPFCDAPCFCLLPLLLGDAFAATSTTASPAGTCAFSELCSSCCCCCLCCAACRMPNNNNVNNNNSNI